MIERQAGAVQLLQMDVEQRKVVTDSGVTELLCSTAAQNGRSMEEEVREILRRALSKRPSRGGLGSRVHQRFAKLVEVISRS